MSAKEAIIIRGARENNLKNVTIAIPKQQITVFTGVSGSGKSSLVFDTIAAESQRQLNETFNTFVRNRMPHYGQPDADAMENLSVAIVIDQKRIGGNARSTVGTVTDIYSLLRLLFSRIGKPYVGEARLFSFNNPEGMCKHCEGLGKVTDIQIKHLIDTDRSLNDGAIRFPTFYPGQARWKRYAYSGFFDNDKKLKDYSKKEWDILLYESPTVTHPLPGWYESTQYEAVIPRLKRSFLGHDNRDKARYAKDINRIVVQAPCPTCHGARLNKHVLAATINQKNIADCAAMEITELQAFLRTVSGKVAEPIIAALQDQLDGLVSVGLDYLSLNRETNTLSGGESQRVKMVRHLGSSLTGLTYILDEPSIGLHAKDVHQLTELIIRLRDKQNTVLVVEHDPDVMTIADHIVDMGPGAGTSGGTVVYDGTLAGLKKAKTLTGKFLNHRPSVKETVRTSNEWLPLKDVSLHNVNRVSTKIPLHVMTVLTGVAGSGKSTLIHGGLAAAYDAITIDQSGLGGSKRSNPATYTGLLDPIRELFARENHVNASLFSANSEGACPECKGLGVVYTDLAFMDPVANVCDVCHGKRFTEKVLNYTLRKKNIYDVLKMSVAEAHTFFTEPELQPVLQRLCDVGLEYISLGQPLNTLSGGERQRIKLAAELDKSGNLYILDEPTTGLHMSDVSKLVTLMNRLVDNGSTVIVIEHNLDVISQADWIIDMGPGGGKNGGKIMFEGTPKELLKNKTSATAEYLRRATGR